MTLTNQAAHHFLAYTLIVIAILGMTFFYATMWAAAAALPGESASPQAGEAATQALTSPTVTVLRIMTFNIHHAAGIDGLTNLERIALTISMANPDIVILNEVDDNWVRSGSVNQADTLALSLSMPYVFYAPTIVRPIILGGDADSQLSRYGNALLSKYPIVNATVEMLPLYGLQEQRAALVADVAVGDRTLCIFGTHLGLNQQERIAQAERLLLLAQEQKSPSLLLGDLNAAPSANEVKMLSAAWVDPAPMAPPTYPTDSPRQRIDYIFVTAELTNSVYSYDTLMTLASDHMPVLMELRF